MLDFSRLHPTFALLANQVVKTMEDKGYEVQPYYGFRSLEEQAKLYRQSRPTTMILQKIEELRDKKCEYLAAILEKVGPQKTGPWATNALPGQSYHQFGLAMDCLLFKKGKPGVDKDYKIYADLSKVLGMTAGYYFHDVDMGHVQLGSTSVPYGYSIKECNDYFEKRAAP